MNVYLKPDCFQLKMYYVYILSRRPLVDFGRKYSIFVPLTSLEFKYNLNIKWETQMYFSRHFASYIN